jgi:hypothetical protein
MKFKPGLVLKVNHDGSNHYVQIINIQYICETLQVQILCGKTVNICKAPLALWFYGNPKSALVDGLLEKIGEAFDKCQPANLL